MVIRNSVAAGAIAAIALFGSVSLRAGVLAAPKAPVCRDVPIIKNLTGFRGQRVCDRMFEPKELTTDQVKKLAATAKAPEDHLTVARYYRTEAQIFDAKAAGYENAAASLRKSPAVKNLTAPGTAARYESFAKGFRAEAKSDRATAAAHEEMGKQALAKL